MSQFYRETGSGPNFDELLAASSPFTPAFAAPAAGADWTITVPAGNYWLPVTVIATLTTGGAAATRTPTFAMTSGGVTVYSAGCINQLTAANQATFQLALALGYSAALAGGSQQQIGVPALLLAPGSTISSATVNIQGADTWSAQSLYVRRVLVSGIGTGPVSTVAEPPLVPTPLAV